MHLALALVASHLIAFVLGYALRGKVHGVVAQAGNEAKKLEGDVKSKL